MRARVTSIFAVAVVTVVALSGCIGGGDTTQFTPPTVTIDQVTVPASMTPTDPDAVIDTQIVPASGSLPWMIGGSLAQPGQPAVPTVWTSPDGSTWTGKPVVDDFQGSFVGTVDASAEIASVTGYVWRDGVTRSVMWTSTDRLTWAEVELPQAFADDFYLIEQSVTGSTIVAIGVDNAGVARGIRITGDTIVEFDMPTMKKGDELGLISAVAEGKNLLLIATPGPTGDPTATVSYLSDDKGTTWGAAVPLTGTDSFVSGVTRSDEGYVATGGGERADDPDSYGPAAWFSPDGQSWTPESVPATPDDSASFFYVGAGAWFGRPLANAGVINAVLTNDNSSVSGVYQRAAGGGWSFIGESNANSSNGSGGSAVSLDGASTVGLIGSDGYGRTGVLSGGNWTDTFVFAPRSNLASTDDVYPSPTGALVTLSTPTFTVYPDLGWRNSTRYTLGNLDGDSLTEVAWNPARAADLTNVQLGSDESGAEVLLGSSFPEDSDTILVEGWFRTGSDAEWVPASGFDTTGATYFFGVDKVGDQWIASGDTRASSNASDTSHAVIWVSSDGVNWARPAGDFGEGVLETSVTGVCTLSDGSAVAVGWVEESGGKYRTAVWKPANGTWTRTDIGKLGTTSGSASSCATGADGVVLAGYIGGRDTLQQSGDGTNWTEVFRADRGIGLGDPVAVPGGFAASGSLTNDEFSGPVVWLSQDGLDWFPITVESITPGSTSTVAPYGDDLVVTMNARTGHPVSLIRNIEKVIDDNKD